MTTIHLHRTLEADGELVLKGLPLKRGQSVELILLPSSAEGSPRSHLTAHQLRHSALIGLWRDREDIQDSTAYARQLREQAQTRRG